MLRAAVGPRRPRRHRRRRGLDAVRGRRRRSSPSSTRASSSTTPISSGAIWTNPGEVAGNGRDDDHNGFVDDVHGANMFDFSANVDDDNGHGTHVAGIVAARQGNGIGGSGIAPEATILPVKVLDAEMSGNTDTLARGIRYAVDRGAKILNVSINTDAPTDAVTDAVALRRPARRGHRRLRRQQRPQHRPAAVLPRVADRPRDLRRRRRRRRRPALELVEHGHAVGRPRRARRASIVSTAPSSVVPVAHRHVGGGAVRRRHARAAVGGAARPLDERPAVDRHRHDPPPGLLATLLGGGRLDAGAAMHRALAGRPWQTAAPARPPAAPDAEAARASPRFAPGRRVKLRWTATGAAAVDAVARLAGRPRRRDGPGRRAPASRAPQPAARQAPLARGRPRRRSRRGRQRDAPLQGVAPSHVAGARQAVLAAAS